MVKLLVITNYLKSLLASLPLTGETKRSHYCDKVHDDDNDMVDDSFYLITLLSSSEMQVFYTHGQNKELEPRLILLFT